MSPFETLVVDAGSLISVVVLAWLGFALGAAGVTLGAEWVWSKVHR